MILERTIFSFTPYHGIVLMVVMLSFLFSHLLVQTSALHGRWSMDGVGGIKKVHRRPTPRIGGIAIALAMLFVWLTLEHGPRLLPFSGMTHGTALRLVELLEPVLIAAIPAFAAGLAEDLTKRVGVAQRLWASLVSGLLLSLLTGVSIQRLDLPGVDALFMAGSLGLFLSYALTAFAAGGLCHAINMIDGVNGLASSAITIMLGAFAWLAWTVDDVHLAWIATSGAAAALGFFLVNFPRGAIFLGDGGAYLLGFLLAAVALALPARNPEISPWASLLICAYPVIEVFFSVLRRRHSSRHPGHPDQLHMHSLLLRRRFRQHAPTTGAVGVMVSLPALAACVFPQQPGALALILLLCLIAYRIVHRRLLCFNWRAAFKLGL